MTTDTKFTTLQDFARHVADRLEDSLAIEKIESVIRNTYSGFYEDVTAEDIDRVYTECIEIAEREAPRSAESESLKDRLTRLEIDPDDVKQKRIESLAIAHDANVSDAIFRTIAEARRVHRNSYTVVVPRHPLESCSRGRGWARKGKGSSAEWGERVDRGYRVGAGVWSVGGHDGFRRKRSDEWVVEHIIVDNATWTIAN